jgi:hypothetical protein
MMAKDYVLSNDDNDNPWLYDNHDLIRWYWREGPGKFDLASRKPGDPPLVVSGRQLREAMQRTMTPAEWRKFKEGVFARIYGGGPDAINRALRGQRAAVMSTTTTPKERHEMTKPKLSRAEVIRQQLKALQEEAAHLARFPEDNFPEHTVLMTWKTYAKDVQLPYDSSTGYGCAPVEKRNFTYTYVLLKANGQWWMTGQNGHQINGASWDKVIDFVDKDDMIDVRTSKSIMLDSDDVKPKLNDRDTLADAVEKVAAKADTPKTKGDPLMDVGY